MGRSDLFRPTERFEVNGVELMVTDSGSTDAPAVLMIHGWPDTAYLWRHQIPVLVEAGYRVLAPDLRGFGRSGKPEAVEAYRVKESVTDMVGILDHAGVDSVHVVAHDWGAAVGWALALGSPERVRTLTALSVGHPNSFGAAGLRQLQKSWYMLLFQFEGIAEEFLSGNDWARFRAFVGDHPEADHWIESLSRPGALTASLNWYRANAHPSRLIVARPPLRNCRVPVLGMWSSRDFALSEEQMTGCQDYVDAEWEYMRIEDASHWIPLDAPDRLNHALLDWLGRH